MLCQRPASDAAFELTELRPAEDQQRPVHHATRSRASRRSLSVTPRPLRPPRLHHRPHRPHHRSFSSTCPAAPPSTCRSTSRPDQSTSAARRHAPGVLRFLYAHHSSSRLTGGSEADPTTKPPIPSPPDHRSGPMGTARTQGTHGVGRQRPGPFGSGQAPPRADHRPPRHLRWPISPTGFLAPTVALGRRLHLAASRSWCL